MADSKREAELLLIIKEAGAKETAAEVQKLATTTTTVQRELAKLSRTDQIQKIGTEMGLLAKKTRDTAAAAKELSKQLQSIGANKDEISAATAAFSDAQQRGGTNRLARLGSEVRALPSQRISLGGTEFGTDAIGNFLRLGGALTGLSEKSAETSTLAARLAPTLGQAGAGFAALAIQAAPFVIAAGVAALAIKSLTDEVQKSADAINKNVDAQRAANEEIVAGLTSDQVRKKQEDLNKARELEQAILDQTTAAYAQFEKETQDAAKSGKDLAASLTEIIFGQGTVVAGAKAVRADEEALNQQRETSIANLAKIDAQTADYNILLESGALAANDAAEAEKKLLEERSKTALATADNAGKELAARQKALNSTEDQNKARLKSIEEEKAVIQAQIDSLTESGVTSEDVTGKIAALTDQLGLLGKESEFISETALEASRAADAQKKAVKDAEDAQKKAAQAQDQYTKAVQSASTTFKQSIEDIGTRLKQTLEDNVTKLERDLVNIEKKNNRDELELTIKANRAERDAYQDQVNDLRKIQRDAQKDEREALIEGDFKQLYLSRLSREEALKEESETSEEERRQREQSQADAREDLKRNLGYQREDRQLAFAQQNFDARVNRDREAIQARTAQTRALAQASSALNAELGLRQQFWNATLKQAQNAINQINSVGAKAQGASANSPYVFTGPFKAVVQR